MAGVVAAFASGALFALGLLVGGMTLPSKIFGFLDFFGDWDPSLMFVMAGAILVNAPLTYWLRQKEKPLLQQRFSIPTSNAPWRSQINTPLVVGAALFGIGWGLGGYCPGPALVALSAPARSDDVHGALVFTAAMLVGMALFSMYDRYRQRNVRAAGHVCCEAEPSRGTLDANGVRPSQSR